MPSKRLIVDAVSYENNYFNEKQDDASLKQLKMMVSVSNAETGEPFQSLVADNFIFSDLGFNGLGSTSLHFIKGLVQRRQDQSPGQPMGIYEIKLTINMNIENQSVAVQFQKGKNFVIGIQVSYQKDATSQLYRGQTVVSLISA